jgi:hypothetical protein
MNNLKLKRCFFIATAIAILAVFTTAPVGAGDLNWKLRGDYAWNATSTCASATSGFTADPFPLRKAIGGSSPDDTHPPDKGISYNYSVQGKFSFDGHGVFDFEGEVLSIMLEPYRATPEEEEKNTYKNFKSPVHPLALDGNGIYTIANEADGLFVAITFSNIKVPGTGIEFNGAIVRGRLDTVMGTSIVFLSTTSPIPEEVIGLSPTPAERICNGTGSMVKLSPRKNWFSKE